MNNHNLYILTFIVAVAFNLATPAKAQDTPIKEVVSEEEDVTGVDNYLEGIVSDKLSDDAMDSGEMLPMPQSTQTETIPNVTLSTEQPKEELNSPIDVSSEAEDVLNNTSAGLTGSEGLYFDSLTKENLQDNPAPRRLDPRYEPASRYIIVEKGASADSHQAMLVAANRALSLGRYSSALELFEKLYEKNKRDRNVLMGLAVAQQNSGFRESAITTYEELLEIDPDNVNANINMLGLIKTQYPSIAYRKLVDLWEKNPRNAGLAAQIGLTSAELGNSDDAIHYLGVAASLEPHNANHFYNMAVIADRAGAQKQAIDYYEKALELDATFGGSRTVPRDSIYDRLSKLRRL